MSDRFPLSVEARYNLLLEILQKLRDTLDLDIILNHLLDSIQVFLDYDAAGIFVLDQVLAHTPGQHQQELIAGIARRGFDAPPPSYIDPMLHQGKGITGQVIRTGASLIVPDVRKDPFYVVGRKNTRSEIAVPILRDGQPIGALNIESDHLAAFNEQHAELLQFFANAASISIEKAILHRQILEKELLEKQLKTAHEVQSRLLPAGPPRRPGYDFAGLCLPTHEIGGDYYDFIRLSKQRLGITIADVSGHGVASALVMAAFRASLRSLARRKPDPVCVVGALNHQLPDFSAQAHFVTAIFGILDPQHHVFSFVNCGHPRPLFFHADGRIESLSLAGPALGIFSKENFPASEVSLSPGDVLLLYTDGVVELCNPDGSAYSPHALVDVVQPHLHRSAAELVRVIVQATSEFAGSAVYEDDYSLMIIKREL
jgi:serine phosphatase RsbU (regulator of sigma subunit)